jgi:hypothetical protein
MKFSGHGSKGKAQQGKLKSHNDLEGATSGLPDYCSRDGQLVHCESITALPEVRWERQ